MMLIWVVVSACTGPLPALVDGGPSGLDGGGLSVDSGSPQMAENDAGTYELLDGTECDTIDAGTGSMCPFEIHERCRLERIRKGHVACRVDSDCVVTRIDSNANCISYGNCPQRAVSASQLAAFRDEAIASLTTYCAHNGGCRSSGLCLELSETPVCTNMGECENHFVVR